MEMTHQLAMAKVLIRGALSVRVPAELKQIAVHWMCGETKDALKINEFSLFFEIAFNDISMRFLFRSYRNGPLPNFSHCSVIDIFSCVLILLCSIKFGR